MILGRGAFPNFAFWNVRGPTGSVGRRFSFVGFHRQNFRCFPFPVVTRACVVVDSFALPLPEEGGGGGMVPTISECVVLVKDMWKLGRRSALQIIFVNSYLPLTLPLNPSCSPQPYSPQSCSPQPCSPQPCSPQPCSPQPCSPLKQQQHPELRNRTS